MAIVKDLIVLGSTRQIGPAYAGTIYAESFVKNGSDSSHVLLGDGTDLALSSLNSSHTHYIGTTQVQNSSAAQGLTGITSIASPASTALYISPASTLYLDSAESTSILFRKGTTEMARFNTSSNLCVGTTSPNDNTTYKLDVGGKGRFSNQIVSSLASGTAPFVVASSTVVSNLNADLLDGKHASAFALSSHDHKRILFNDTRSSVETPTNVAAYDGIRIDFKNKSASSIPSTGNYTAIVSFDGYSDTSGGYPSQMGFSMSDLSESRPFYFRSPKTASQWGAWRCMLDSLTYTTYTVNKQGLGATGTWNISITGNAATATNADKLDNFHATELLTNVEMYAGGNSTKIDVTVGGTTLTGSVIVPYASNAGSVDWDDITNIPGEFALSSHNHDDRYVTALGTSGNYVTWTKNGTTNNLTVPYATNAGTASSVPWSGVTNKPSYLYSYQASASQTTVDWARNVAYSSVTRRAFIYNNSGTEWNYLFGFSSSSTSDGKSKYGAVLKWGYADNYIRIQRQYNGVWYTEDWEKISAGKADTAATATTATTATNLASNPSLQTSGTTQITVTAGNKTSAAFTVPYATTAGSASTVPSAGNESLPVYVNSSGVPKAVENIDASYLKGYAGQKNNMFLVTHPEYSKGVIIPYINNELSFLLSKGGDVKVYSTSSTDFTQQSLTETTIWYSSSDQSPIISKGKIEKMFNGSPDYCGFNNGNASAMNPGIVIDITLDRKYTYENKFYIDFGQGFGYDKIDILVKNNNNETNYVAKHTNEDIIRRSFYMCRISHTSTNSSTNSTENSFTHVRIHLYERTITSGVRIAQIGLLPYDSIGQRQTSMSRGIDDYVYRSITPAVTTSYSLGSSSKRWNYLYANRLNLSNWNDVLTNVWTNSYLPLSGGTITGNLSVNGNTTLGDANADTITIKAKNIDFNNTTSIDFTNLQALWGTL